MTVKRKQQPKPPAPEPAVRDVIGERLIECGFVPNEFLLDLNHGLTAPADTLTEPPWNLPSRVFQFPIEVSDVDGDGCRRVGLAHPCLAEHPFVKRVEAALGFALDRDGAPNKYGWHPSRSSTWFHAVDLVPKGLWREALATRQFTTSQDILRAITYALDYGQMKPADARLLLSQLDAAEPSDRLATLALLHEPSFCKPDNSAGYWAINERFKQGKPADAAKIAWGRVLGIEAGWFKLQGRFLHWSDAGRAIYEAVAKGKAVGHVEDKHGQFGFVI